MNAEADSTIAGSGRGKRGGVRAIYFHQAEPETIYLLTAYAKAVLDARAAHPEATLADLYDPDLMPPHLRKAHQTLDRAVDRLYRCAPFASERERVEHLFMLYEKMRAPLEAAMKAKRRRSRRKG